jgi:hypothetical protein
MRDGIEIVTGVTHDQVEDDAKWAVAAAARLLNIDTVPTTTDEQKIALATLAGSMTVALRVTQASEFES